MSLSCSPAPLLPLPASPAPPAPPTPYAPHCSPFSLCSPCPPAPLLSKKKTEDIGVAGINGVFLFVPLASYCTKLNIKDLIAVFEAILTGGQKRSEITVFGNPVANNFFQN